MSNRRPTVAQVVAQANAAREELAKLDRDLQEGIDEIDFTAFRERRERTDAEMELRKSLRAAQAEARESFTVLAFVTAQRLDDTAEVEHLIHRMEDINAGLQDDLDGLKKLEKYAKIAAKVADALAKGAEKLAKIAAEGIKPA